MPTRIIPTRKIADDLSALNDFVVGKQENWKTVNLHMSFFKEQYFGYLNDFSGMGKYRELRPDQDESDVKILNKLYDQKPKCLGYIAELRRKASRSLAVCPYCGLPAGKITLDHYLPKDANAFPHFSIFSFNLVPACVACQLKKGNSSPPERVLHPYFDKFVSRIVWRLVPRDFRDPIATLTLVPARKCPQEQKIVMDHIKKLGIQERFRNEIAHLVNFTVTAFRSGDVVTRDQARTKASDLLLSYMSKDLTPNSISCTFFRALRDYRSLADVVIGMARAAPPRRTIKSQGVSL